MLSPMTTTTYNIKHSRGHQSSHVDYDGAIAELRAVYGSEIVVAGSESELLAGHVSRALVWRDEAASHDDDGTRAVASIRVTFEVD